jgi:hypothetical protein
MAVLVDQFATIFVDHSERKPSCFRFEDPVWSYGAGPRDNDIGWDAMLSVSGGIAKVGKPVSGRVS